MREYLNLLQRVLDEGNQRGARTGTGTSGVFGHQMRFDLSEGFPLCTTKKVHWPSVLHELIWFTKGDTNIKYLVDNGVRIWNEWPFQSYLKQNGLEEKFPKHTPEWSAKMKEFVTNIKEDPDFAKKWGELGPVYGRQWRNFNGFDQLDWVVNEIKNNPNSRRLIVSAWNPPEIEEMSKSGLPPCHCLYQFYVQDGKLSCQLYQRSADIFLGVPFNIASYAILTMMVAQVTGLQPGEFVHTLGDAHLYSNHVEQAHTQLSREPKALPQVKINQDITSLFDFTYGDFELLNYDPHPLIKAPIAV